MAVESLKEQGLNLSESCRFVGLSRSVYYDRKNPRKKPEKKPDPDELAIVERIKQIKADHPFWGYRRVRAWLCYREGVKISKNKVYRFMKEHNLTVNRLVHKAKRRLGPVSSNPDRGLEAGNGQSFVD